MVFTICDVHDPRRCVLPESFLVIVYHFPSGSNGLNPSGIQIREFDSVCIGIELPVIDMKVIDGHAAWRTLENTPEQTPSAGICFESTLSPQNEVNWASASQVAEKSRPLNMRRFNQGARTGGEQ
ncbi:hypothetical protein [Mesorhizobium sp.]|uniref:hypothetical protein n=1 Tax=Mesorhizobium sp. TaxID=1871066 RepID=UPI000FE88181|nr:hypothetical protein [Mesorhizobium sp.]RWE34451.1 MAG: hypothetical protein EOS77_09835 [Mesorhizobium sp.]